MIEEIMAAATNESDGEVLTKAVDCVPSTMNLMAAHLSGLIKLAQFFFKKQKLKSGNEKLDKLRDYYLYADNIDTLSGYLGILANLNKSKIVTNGFCWMVLELLKTNFYNSVNIKEADDNHAVHTARIAAILKQQEALKKNLDGSVTTKHLKWVKSMLAS
jgi:hypothetical protein